MSFLHLIETVILFYIVTSITSDTYITSAAVTATNKKKHYVLQAAGEQVIK